MDSAPQESFVGFTTGSGRKLPGVSQQQLKRALQIMPDLADLPLSQETRITASTANKDAEPQTNHPIMEESTQVQALDQEHLFSSAAYFRPFSRRRTFAPFDTLSKAKTESATKTSECLGNDGHAQDTFPVTTADADLMESHATTSLCNRRIPEADSSVTKTPALQPNDSLSPSKESPKRPSPTALDDRIIEDDSSRSFKSPRVSISEEAGETKSDIPIVGFTTGSGKAVKAPPASTVAMWRKKLLMDEDIFIPKHLPGDNEEGSDIGLPSEQPEKASALKNDYIPSHQERSSSSAKISYTTKSPSPSPSSSPTKTPTPPLQSTPSSGLPSPIARQDIQKTSPKMMPGSNKKAFKPPRAVKNWMAIHSLRCLRYHTLRTHLL